ncbi:MAG: hypothetical protein FWH16_02740 [Oscillospiraceae bacterium]|nr:hypothetical protein [Oscillospiraceae bacterium]
MKKLRFGLMLAMMTIVGAMSVTAFATGDGGTADVSGMLQTAFTKMLADIMASMGIILPIALSIFGALFAAKIGIRMFKSFAGGSAG